MKNINIPEDSFKLKSQNRFKMLLINILLLLTVCIILLGILEVFLKIYTVPYNIKIMGDKIIIPSGVKKHTKYFNDKTDKLDNVIYVTQNSLGFRGNEPIKDFSKKLTIIAVGGSTTINYYISDGKTWVDLLGKKLKTVFRDTWINNAGFQGMSTVGHIALMHHIVKLRPKIILFLVGVNDKGDPRDIGLGKGWEKKAEEFKNIENKHNKLFLFIKSIISPAITRQVTTFIKRISRHSEVFALALNVKRNIEAYEMKLPEISEDMDLGKYKSIEISEENRRIIRERMADSKSRAILNGYENRLKTLIQIARENNIEPIFITQTVLTGNAIDDVTKIDLAKINYFSELIFDGALLWEWMETVNDSTRKVAKKENVFLVDLANKLPKSSKYYIDMIHYSNEGNEKAAEIIYDNLCPYLARKYNDYSINDCNVSILQR